jgi:hypothetical protein
LLLLATIQSTYFFLCIKNVNFIAWITFNACAVANITFLVGFILFLIFRNRTVMYMAILPLFFFGTCGLFVFPWSGMHIIPQIGHIIMTLNMIVIITDLYKEKDFKAGATGLLIGTFVFAWFLGLQQNYVYRHMDEFQRIIGFPEPKNPSLNSEAPRPQGGACGALAGQRRIEYMERGRQNDRREEKGSKD